MASVFLIIKSTHKTSVEYIVKRYSCVLHLESFAMNIALQKNRLFLHWLYDTKDIYDKRKVCIANAYICIYTYIHIWLIEEFLRKILVICQRFYIFNTYFLHKIKKICLSAFLLYCLNNLIVCDITYTYEIFIIKCNNLRLQYML